MNLLRTVFNRLQYWSNQPTTSRIVHTGRTQARVFVDEETALKNATIWACIQYLTKALGQLPWHVMIKADGEAAIASTHPVDWLLSHRPCPDMGSFSWRQAMLGSALRYGNAYAEIERDNRGMPYALWPIHPQRVCVRRNESNELEYEVWNRNGNSVLSASDVFHLRGFGDGPVGYSVIAYAAESIGWAQATEIFGATYFGEGMNPSGVIETVNPMGIEGKAALEAEIKQLYSGPRGKKTILLDNGMKFTRLSTNPNDSQFIETRQHQVEEICRWFGVPPHKVMHLLRATFSNIEHQSIEVVVDSITPWARLFEEEADYKLFGAQNRQGFYTKINLNGLLRGDMQSRMIFYKGMVDMGLPPNRVFALEDVNGIGPDGDTSFISNNLQTMDRAIRGQPVRTQPAAGDPLPDDAAPLPKTNGASHAARH